MQRLRARLKDKLTSHCHSHSTTQKAPTLGRVTTGHILVCVVEEFILMERTVTLHLQSTQNNPKDDTIYTKIFTGVISSASLQNTSYIYF